MSTLDSCELLDDEPEASKCDVLPDGIKHQVVPSIYG